MEHGIEIETLIAHTSSGAAANKPFGYAAVMEMQQIEDKLKAEGVDERRLTFAVARAYEEAHRHDLSFRQRQDLARWLGLPWAGGSGARRGGWLTVEELDYLAERLKGVNDPIGQAIREKVLATRK